MKILHVNEFWSPRAGPEQYLVDICIALNQLGHENAVVYGIKKEDTIDNPRIKSYHFPSIIPSVKEIFPYKRRRVCKEFVTLINKENPDIIFFHAIWNPFLVDIAVTLKPTIREALDYRIFCPGALRYRYLTNTICKVKPGLKCWFYANVGGCGVRLPHHRLARLIMRKVDVEINKKVHRMIAVSEYVAKELILSGIDEKRIVVNLPFKDINNSEVNYQSTGKNILYVGRLERTKGIDFLIRAMKLLDRECHLDIIGVGRMRKKLEQLAHNLQLSNRVRFLGWIPNVELREYYKKAQVFVLPSVWPEPLGIVILEAMANSVPVVASGVGGIKEMVKEGETGFLVKPKDVRELAHKIKNLLDNSELRKKFGENGKRFVQETVNKERHLKILLETFKAACDVFKKSVS
jgi:glycosyltransferase involved in cell wall biosynthesis